MNKINCKLDFTVDFGQSKWMTESEFFKFLNSQNLSHLEKRAGVSRQALHSALKTWNMKLDNLRSVAKALNLKVEFRPAPTEENLLSSLARWGAPLAYKKGGSLSFEETVAEALRESRKDGVYETLVPYVLSLNADRLNPLGLAGLAYQDNQVNVLGYFTEMAQVFRPNEKLEKLLQLLSVAKNPKEEFLVLSTKTHFPELFNKNQLARRWNLKVRGSVEDHLERWKKWELSQGLS